jgi:hypothetical protein
MKLYINILTLVLFLLLGIPGIRERVNFDRSSSDDVAQVAGGFAAIMIGLVVVSTSLWVGDTHVYEGVNWTHVLNEFLFGSGLASMGLGFLVLLTPLVRDISAREVVRTG